MRKFIVVALGAATLITPATASAAPNVCGPAYKARLVVIAKLGHRAPGRNICRFGIKPGHVATVAQKRRYLSTLRALVRPAPRYLVRTAVAPTRAPAGTLSPGIAAGGTLSSIAACESGGNPGAISKNGLYRGKYQFTYSTWAGVGGSGDPASAPEAEQDRRAAMLYAREGAHPWPVCGR